MNKLTKKDVFVQKLKGRPIHVEGKDKPTSDDLLILLECGIIKPVFLNNEGVQKTGRYCVQHCIHLSHPHISPAGNWLENTRIIEPGTWV